MLRLEFTKRSGSSECISPEADFRIKDASKYIRSCVSHNLLRLWKFKSRKADWQKDNPNKIRLSTYKYYVVATPLFSFNTLNTWATIYVSNLAKIAIAIITENSLYLLLLLNPICAQGHMERLDVIQVAKL